MRTLSQKQPNNSNQVPDDLGSTLEVVLWLLYVHAYTWVNIQTYMCTCTLLGDLIPCHTSYLELLLSWSLLPLTSIGLFKYFFCTAEISAQGSVSTQRHFWNARTFWFGSGTYSLAWFLDNCQPASFLTLLRDLARTIVAGDQMSSLIFFPRSWFSFLITVYSKIKYRLMI